MYCRIRAFMIREAKKEVRADFEQFLQEVFRENVTSDGITLNYTLKILRIMG